MKLTSSLLAASLVVGLGGAVAAYRTTTADLPSLESPTALAVGGATSAPPQVVRPGTRFRWAPCAEGATLEKGVCVRDVVQTIVIPAPAPAPAPDYSGSDDDEDESYEGEDESYDDEDEEYDEQYEDEDEEDEDEDEEDDDEGEDEDED